MLIPSLDLKDYLSCNSAKRQKFVQDLGDALRKVGFFSLSSWTESYHLVMEAYAAAKEFFALTPKQKRGYSYPELHGQVGYVGLGEEKAKDALTYDLKEFWHVSRLAVENPLASEYALWPREVSQMQSSMSALYVALESCAELLLEACALYLGLPKDRFSSMIHKGPTLLRILHYPALCLDPYPAGALRAAAHEDINLITLLCASTAQGLEICDRKGVWHGVDVRDSRELIVDSGDMLQNLTNGIIPSTTHRVVNISTDKESRYSMPCFIHPRGEEDLSPLSECVSLSGGKVIYPQIDAKTYLQQRLREIGLL